MLRMKKQGTNWEKIYSNHISYKGHIFKIHTELKKSIKRKHTSQLQVGKIT